MIDKALDFIAEDINRHLQRVQRDKIERVILSSLVDQEGSPPIETENKVVLVLNALDEEKNVYDGQPSGRGTPSVTRNTEPIYLNLHVIFAATHKHYLTSLAALSSIIGYIKSKPVFDGRNTPQLPAEINRLYFNMEKIGYGDLCNVWSYLGANYLPSVNYTIRMVGVGARRIEALVPAVQSIGAET
jgi:hypothetical protein